MASRIEMQMKEERGGGKKAKDEYGIVKVINSCNILTISTNSTSNFSPPPRSFISVHVVKCSSLSIKNITLTPEIERPISLVVPGKLTFLYFTIHLKGTRLNLERFLTY